MRFHVQHETSCIHSFNTLLYNVYGVNVMDDWLKQFGKVVFRAREGLGMTQLDVGNAINVDQRTIHNIEHGLANPTIKILFPLVRVLHIDPKEIFYPEQSQDSPARKQLRQMIDNCNESEASTLLGITRDILTAIRSPNSKPVN